MIVDFFWDFSMQSAVPVVVLILSSMMWGLVWWPLKQVQVYGIEGIPLIAIAHTAVSVVLLPFLFLQFNAWRAEWRAMLAIAVVGGSANIAFNAAMAYGDVVRVMVLFYLLPVWGVLGGRLFLRERIDLQRGVSVVLALLGAFVMLGASFDLFDHFSWVDGVALTSGFLFAMNNILFRATVNVPLMSKIGLLFLGGALVAGAALSLGVGTMPPLTSSVIVVAIAVGACWWLLATLGSQWAVTRLEAGRSAVIMVIELVTAVVSSAWLGAKGLLPYEIAGVTCVLTATLLESWRRAESAPPPHPIE